MGSIFSRRAALVGAASSAVALGLSDKPLAQIADVMDRPLVDDALLGEMASYDASVLGPAETRAPRGPFLFPSDADSETAYGIDISHHTEEVPWSALKNSRVSYIYIKASQAEHSRDEKFETHWKAAKAAGMPRGAFHWLTPGVSGKVQGEYFVSRIKAGGGLAKGDLQPVIDLEWDYLGKDFKRVVLSKAVVRGKEVVTYRDYWVDYSSDEIMKVVNECVTAISSAFPTLGVRPIIYTNKSWWDVRLHSDVRFQCAVWPSDYRTQSYKDGIPRLVVGHDYHFWQFTDKGTIIANGKHYGPFDCNKIIKGKIHDFVIT